MIKKTILCLFLSTFCLIGCDFIQIRTDNISNDSNTSNSSVDYQSGDTSNSSTSSHHEQHDDEHDEKEDPIKSDPYVNVNKKTFYSNYKPAVSLNDAKYRTQHYLLSGSIETITEKPKTEENPKMEGLQYVKNSSATYCKDNQAYKIYDVNGKYVSTIYKDGAYITLDEVAAYVYAFNNVPKNWTNGKSTNLLDTEPYSNWGEYLRLNNNVYTLNLDKYPYEPEFPDYENVKYYEMDFGTTTTYKGPDKKTNPEYNTGDKITRGTCRIVYSESMKNSSQISFTNRHVFYTYNHYNDFQEFLNYSGGWGKRFGNMTGGGPYNSQSPSYKTPYPKVVLKSFI